MTVVIRVADKDRARARGFLVRHSPGIPTSSLKLRRETCVPQASNSPKSRAKELARSPGRYSRVKEYELYLPLFLNDGSPVSDQLVDDLMERLVEEYGGCTFFPQPNKGMWKMADVVYHDDIVIYRMITAKVRAARKFLRALKQELMRELEQETILIVEKDADAL